MLTPIHMELLFHYHSVFVRFPRPSHGSKQCTQWLLEQDLIARDPGSGSGYHTTERGRAYVERILATPLPERDPQETD